MVQQGSSLVVKLRLNDDVRKVALHNVHDLSLSDLVCMAQRVFSVDANIPLRLKYRDDDNDLITLADDNDVLLARQSPNDLYVEVLLGGVASSLEAQLVAAERQLRDVQRTVVDLLAQISEARGVQVSEAVDAIKQLTIHAVDAGNKAATAAALVQNSTVPPLPNGGPKEASVERALNGHGGAATEPFEESAPAPVPASPALTHASNTSHLVHQQQPSAPAQLAVEEEISLDQSNWRGVPNEDLVAPPAIAELPQFPPASVPPPPSNAFDYAQKQQFQQQQQQQQPTPPPVYQSAPPPQQYIPQQQQQNQAPPPPPLAAGPPPPFYNQQQQQQQQPHPQAVPPPPGAGGAPFGVPPIPQHFAQQQPQQQQQQHQHAPPPPPSAAGALPPPSAAGQFPPPSATGQFPPFYQQQQQQQQQQYPPQSVPPPPAAGASFAPPPGPPQMGIPAGHVNPFARGGPTGYRQSPYHQ